MKKKLILIFFTTLFIISTGVVAQNAADTNIVNSPEADELIDEVLQNRALLTKEKVQYFTQVTKYGFKNLFAKLSYNPSQTYSSQVNPNAEAYMQDYLAHHGKGLIQMKNWCGPYFSLIDNIFSQYGLPKELKYLAVIESHLKTTATSWVGASGPWQFMPYTARENGLIVNGAVDERRDYYKSTHAAAKYLLTLYKQTKDWLLVIAAYNGGPGRVFTAIKRSGSRNFWALQYFLPTESRNHVKKFIATHYIMEGNNSGMPLPSNISSIDASYDSKNVSKNSYDAKPNLTNTELETVGTQSISGKFNSVVIAKNLSMNISEFNHYNPVFDDMIANNGNYDLRLPVDKMQLFMANKYAILNECVQILLSNDVISNSPVFYPERNKKTVKKKRTK
jgi:membrane-bound lytic murein transglycosylase D